MLVLLNTPQGGNVLGNGTWLNVGGNQAVQYGGETAKDQNGGAPYNDPDGGKSCVLSIFILLYLMQNIYFLSIRLVHDLIE